MSEKKIGSLFAGFIAAYLTVFYVFYRFDPRFVVPLVPFFSMIGGYAIARLWGRHTAVALCIFLSVPLMVALRLSYLAVQGDTREHARSWVLEHLSPSDHVL